MKKLLASIVIFALVLALGFSVFAALTHQNKTSHHKTEEKDKKKTSKEKAKNNTTDQETVQAEPTNSQQNNVNKSNHSANQQPTQKSSQATHQTSPSQSTQAVIKSDQLFRQYDKKSKKASLVDIPLKKQLKLTDLQKSYGKDLKKVDNGKNNTTGIYYYQPKKNGEAVWFDASKGKIDRVVIGYEKTKVAIQKDKTLNKIK